MSECKTQCGEQQDDSLRRVYEQVLETNNLEQTHSNCPIEVSQLVVMAERDHHVVVAGLGELFRRTAGPDAVLAYEGMDPAKVSYSTGLTPDEMADASSWEDKPLYERGWSLMVEEVTRRKRVREIRARLWPGPDQMSERAPEDERQELRAELDRLYARQVPLATELDAVTVQRSEQAVNYTRALLEDGKRVYLLIGDSHIDEEFLQMIGDIAFAVVRSREEPQYTQEDLEAYYLPGGNAQ